ncbi:MAG: transporter substrate-binding domain-containing protein [Burkholderiaceae bacterium]|jgi:polar amino acid transport system substrate-binding protein
MMTTCSPDRSGTRTASAWWHRWLVLCVSLCIGLSALASEPQASTLQAIKKRGVLVVGVKKDVPLWGMLNPTTQKLEGLEVDLARDLAKRLGVKLELVGLLTAERLDWLESRRVDVLIATVANTPERRSQMTFVLPHYHASGTSVVARKSEQFSDWSDLRNRRICSRRDAYFNRPVAVKYGADIVALYSAKHALQALRDGRCAGFLYGDTQISALLADPLYKDRYEMALPPINLTPWAVTIHRLDKGSDLEAAVSQVLVQWFREGVISSLQKEWGLHTPAFTREREKLWRRKDGGTPYCGEQVGPKTPEECL